MIAKLILLEGIPGSGKTTAGEHLQKFLESQGLTVQFWREGNFDNPADFEGVACLNEAEYENILRRYPELSQLFQQQLRIQEMDYLLWYRKLQSLHPQKIPQTLIDELSRYDVYDGAPLGIYRRLALLRWREFQRSAKESSEITILECCLLQNPLTVMLARHNVDPKIACQHIFEIAQIVQKLNPLIVYLSPKNTRAALEHVRSERPREWAEFVTWYLTGQAYGETHHLEGYEGIIQFYEMRQQLELELLKGLPIPSLIVEQTGANWECSDQQVINWVDHDLR